MIIMKPNPLKAACLYRISCQIIQAVEWKTIILFVTLLHWIQYYGIFLKHLFKVSCKRRLLYHKIRDICCRSLKFKRWFLFRRFMPFLKCNAAMRSNCSFLIWNYDEITVAMSFAQKINSVLYKLRHNEMEILSFDIFNSCLVMSNHDWS